MMHVKLSRDIVQIFGRTLDYSNGGDYSSMWQKQLVTKKKTGRDGNTFVFKRIRIEHIKDCGGTGCPCPHAMSALLLRVGEIRD